MTTTDSGSTTIRVLEQVYDLQRAAVPDLPTNIAFVLQASGRRARSVVYGHYGKGRYRADGDAIHEVMISGETLALGPNAILTTVLHEATHVVADVRNIQDTSRQGRYHNRRFVATAEEFGLAYEHEKPDSVRGYSAVTIPEAVLPRFIQELALLREDVPLDMGQGHITPTAPRQRTHGYMIFEDRTLHVIAPERHASLAPYLLPHVYLTSHESLLTVRLVAFELGLIDYPEDTPYWVDPDDYPELTAALLEPIQNV